MRTDAILDSNYDLTISNGDFLVDVSDLQNVEQILISGPGHWKQNPLLGAFVQQDLNGPINPSMKSRISSQLSSDGYGSAKITYGIDGGINIKL